MLVTRKTAMAKNLLSCSTFLYFLLGYTSISNVFCTPLFESPDLKGLFYSEVDEFLNQQNEQFVPAHPVEVQGWPKKPIQGLGQLTSVAVNPNHQPVIFHRGPRTWDFNTFNESNHYQLVDQGPIQVDTILTLDSDTGEVVDSWGNDFFYLPHSLTIDNYGYYYMTDTALHQAFKFKPKSKNPSLVFGQKFEPGSGLHHLCKPTDVAVATTGEIFIADGYCNSRILKYDSNGNLLYVFPQNEEVLPLKIPHSITLLQDLDVICIADRENKRIVCPEAGLRKIPLDSNAVMTIQDPDMGRVFAVTSSGNKIYAVNGASIPMVQVRGLTIDPIEEAIVDQWSPSQGLEHPHDVEICQNTSSLYVVELTPPRIWKFQLRRLY